VLGGREHWLGPVIGALVIYSLQERLTNSGFGEWGQVILGAILVVVILFAPEGLYARLRDDPRRAALAGVTLVATTLVAGFAGWGIATDWLATGLAAATLVLLVGGSRGRRRRIEDRRELASSPAGDAAVR
jgi:branched-chain amino acid transport system permease protein